MVVLIILLILALIFAIIVTIKHNGNKNLPSTPIRHAKLTTDEKGKEGEKIVREYLNTLLKSDEYLLTNILLPLSNGNTTEIDAIFITHKGIFCVETKNWIGHLSGDDEGEYWIQKYDNPIKSPTKHRNPVKQNENHCFVIEKILNKELNEKYYAKNVVIFPFIEDHYNLYSHRTYTLNEFNDYYNNLSTIIDYSEDLEAINEALSIYVATEEELEEHKKRIRKTYKED